MNQTLQIIAERYSCRNYTDEMPTDEQLQAIAKAAVQAPSAMNQQPWQIIVVTNKQLLEDMQAEGMRVLSLQSDSSGYNRIMSRGGKLFYNAPCMVVVAIDSRIQHGFEKIDLGIVLQNIALAATSLGLGNVICGFIQLAFAGERKEEFKKRLGFSEDFECGAAVLIGYAVNPANPHETDFSKINYIK
jgi:nitroreductase